MRLMIALVTLCMLCGAFAAHSLAGQAEIDRAKRELDAARQAYANSDAQTRQAEQHVNDVRANIDNARAKQRELPRQIDSDKAALDNLKTQIDDAQKTTDQAQQAAADTKKKADDRRAGLKGLQAAITSANADVDRIRKAETARFEATDDFKTQQIQLDLLQSRYDAAAAKVVEKLSADSAFKAAQADAEAAEALVKKLRESGPADQLPAASQAWIKAKTRVETMKSDAIAADPDARSAKADLKKQQAVVAALRATFEDQLKSNPDFAAATQRAGDSVTAVTAANADLRKFDTDLAARSKCPLVALLWQLDRLGLEEMLVEGGLTVRPGVLSSEAMDKLGVEYRERKRNRDRCLANARTAEDIGACLSSHPFP